MSSCNDDIRQAARTHRIYLYEVAEQLGVSESAFCRRLRNELDEIEKEKIFRIISEIAAER